MTYDWDGKRTRRIQTFRLMTVVIAGLILPLAITAWTYVG